MAPSFGSKIVLIIGAGRGIGRGASIKLAKLGATLALTDINEASLDKTCNLCTSTNHHYTSAFDVGSTEKCNEYVSVIISKYNGIGHIFNCIGINGVYQSTVDVTDAHWDKMFNTNAKGFLNITRACIPYLKSGAPLVNPISAFGISPVASFAAYRAINAAVIGFSMNMALELGPRRIRTNITVPEAVRAPTNLQVIVG
jgi:NAD(P)-dependent dehydrogenase (short-subunit alcohol dehydrogenase family)